MAPAIRNGVGCTGRGGVGAGCRGGVGIGGDGSWPAVSIGIG